MYGATTEQVLSPRVRIRVSVSIMLGLAMGREAIPGYGLIMCRKGLGSVKYWKWSVVLLEFVTIQ